MPGSTAAATTRPTACQLKAGGVTSASSSRVKGSSTSMPPAVMATSRAAASSRLGHSRSSTEYATQLMPAASTQPSPTVKRTASRLRRSPLAMTNSTPASASATPTTWLGAMRSPSSTAPTTAMATGVAA